MLFCSMLVVGDMRAECYFARVDIPPAQVLRKFKQRGGGGGNMNVTCQQGIRM